MRGISLWMFSKIIMLIFLMITFSTVVVFLKMMNEKVSADSALVLATQVKDSIQTTLNSNTLFSKAAVPIPNTLPEKTQSIAPSGLKTFNLTVSTVASGQDQLIYVIIGWGDHPSEYVAASSFKTSGTVTLVPAHGVSLASSKNDKYFVVIKEYDQNNNPKLCIKACKSGTCVSTFNGCP